jgi:hypothetical protein
MAIPMIRRLSVLCALLLFAVSAVAQAQPIDVGLRAGTTVSSFQGNTGAITRGGALEAERRHGLHVSGFVSIPLNEVLALRPELMYVQKGASVDDTRAFGTSTDGPIAVREAYRFSYLQLPLLLEVRIPTGGAFQTHLVLGPSIGANLQATIERNEDVVTEAIPESEVHAFEVGFTTGFEFGYRVGEAGTATLGAHYDLGINQVIMDDAAAARKGKEAEFRNGALTLSVGYRFAL